MAEPAATDEATGVWALQEVASSVSLLVTTILRESGCRPCQYSVPYDAQPMLA